MNRIEDNVVLHSRWEGASSDEIFLIGSNCWSSF